MYVLFCCVLFICFPPGNLNCCMHTLPENNAGFTMVQRITLCVWFWDLRPSDWNFADLNYENWPQAGSGGLDARPVPISQRNPGPQNRQSSLSVSKTCKLIWGIFVYFGFWYFCSTNLTEPLGSPTDAAGLSVSSHAACPMRNARIY